MNGKSKIPPDIPAERRERNPLITEEGHRLLNRILQHPDAPRWNYTVGDRLREEDLPLLNAYRARVVSDQRQEKRAPSEKILSWIEGQRDGVSLFRDALPKGFDLRRDWAHVPTSDREDVALRPQDFLPDNADIDRLIVYDTSGTTGHPLVVPHHPLAMAQNQVLIESALARHGVRPEFGPGRLACINLGAQEANTVVFANVFAVWGGAGFAKVNLTPGEWPSIEAARRFFTDLNPIFLTGDPVGFAELLLWEIELKPAALLSTAVALSKGLKERLEGRYGCPVIDWYSTTETGPIAYSCPDGNGMHLLPPDIHVEVLAPEGEPGEIAVTGGRNPYLPLLQYRTGDWGRMEFGPCPCGDDSPRILDLEGREPVLFRTSDGGVVNAIDMGRILREFPIVQHEVVQRSDGSCDVALRFLPGGAVNLVEIERRIQDLLGPDTPVRVRSAPDLDDEAEGKKVQAFRSEI